MTAPYGPRIPIGDGDPSIRFIPPGTAAAVLVEATDVGRGCGRCGTQHTVLLHPDHGRQCPDHITTLPPGPFRSDLAADICDLGRTDAAFAYLRAWVAREIDARFGRAFDALAVAW